MYTVYMHTFPNKKKYIGITKQKPQRRWCNGIGYISNKYMYNAIKKYGWENIKHEILYTNLSQEEAEKKEIELISFFNSANREHGYNLELGGIKNININERTRKKLKKARPHKHPRTYTDEQKMQLSIYMKNCWKDDEHRKKIMEGIKQKHCKKVMCIETQEIYGSIKEAGIMTNVERRHIGDCTKGYRKKAGGFHWKLVGE